MTPLEIKIELLKAGITQVSVAKMAGVSPSQVRRVICGSVSDNVRRAIAKAIKKDVEEIWPEYYLRKSATA